MSLVHYTTQKAFIGKRKCHKDKSMLSSLDLLELLEFGKEANDSHDKVIEPRSEKNHMQEYQPRVLYPTRLKRDKDDTQFKKFLEMIKQLRINIPLIEAFAQMPKYEKFMKELLTNRKKLEESLTVSLEKALADSGASINIMPYKLFPKLGLHHLEPIGITIQLADHSVRCPQGIVSDVIVKVGGLVFPTDFVILDVDEDTEVSIILGRPFLATSQALLDIQHGR
ncbi:uncharacterized protein LOC120254044 [Dioscorea cayenensis subsp. rotundata]|uniref:Uncharacterized protein LOC120254044 n=1 Tax=Dioscorea cayennensis subsp. rotundata TaxID=55577 RepID=A0AB40AT16_DIOCR|nr:uncharacterized protein LOC120254044 [Dioscorea cayenensis subsp. rotundata]